MNIKFFLHLYLFFNIFNNKILFGSFTFKKRPEDNSLKPILEQFKKSNIFIEKAITCRRDAINNKEPNIHQALLPKERNLEWDAYTSFFNLTFDNQKAIGNENEIFRKIESKWNNIITYLESELSFNINLDDLNSYHNLHFNLDNFHTFKTRNITTDNHSSKLFIQNKEIIFLGDLLDRHLPHTYKDNQDNPFKYFNFLKYNYFMLNMITRQINFKLSLQKENITFEDLEYICLLGNHDCGNVLKKDFASTTNGLFSYKYYDIINTLFLNIDKITRFLIPTEIIFTENNTENNTAFIFSHSGGMFLLGDNVKKEEKKYSNFTLSSYQYSLSQGIKGRYNKLTNPRSKLLINKIAIAMNEMNIQDTFSNPFIWCDFFTPTEEYNQCSYDKKFSRGRYSLMDVTKSDLLLLLLDILNTNYQINITQITSFRGHEHGAADLEKFNKPYYNCMLEEDNLKCISCSLAPTSFDNLYRGLMNEEYEYHDQIITINNCIEETNPPIPQIQYNKPSGNQKISLLKFFFDDEKMYNLYNNIVNLCENIENIHDDNISKETKGRSENYILTINDPIPNDEEIIINTFNALKNKFIYLESFKARINQIKGNKITPLKSILRECCVILSQLTKLSKISFEFNHNKNDVKTNINFMEKFIEQINELKALYNPSTILEAKDKVSQEKYQKIIGEINTLISEQNELKKLYNAPIILEEGGKVSEEKCEEIIDKINVLISEQNEKIEEEKQNNKEQGEGEEEKLNKIQYNKYLPYITNSLGLLTLLSIINIEKFGFFPITFGLTIAVITNYLDKNKDKEIEKISKTKLFLHSYLPCLLPLIFLVITSYKDILKEPFQYITLKVLLNNLSVAKNKINALFIKT